MTYLKELSLNILDITQNSIAEILQNICNSIRDKNEVNAHKYITCYSRACSSYEIQSLIFLSHIPNSRSFARRLGNYYLRLRGDFIQGQLWQQKEESLNITMFENSRNKSKNNLSTATIKANDTATTNRIKSQTVVHRIKSKSVIASSILFSIVFIILVFVAFYSYSTSNLNYIMSDIFPLTFARISSHPIITLSGQISFSMEVLSACNPEYADSISLLNQSLIWPNDTTVNLLSTLMQNISHCISNLDRNVDGALTAIDIWANPQTDLVGSKSLEFQVVLLNMIASLLQPGQCDQDSYDYFDEYSNASHSLRDPMRELHAALLTFGNSVYKTFITNYIIYCACFEGVLAILIITIIGISTHFSIR